MIKAVDKNKTIALVGVLVVSIISLGLLAINSKSSQASALEQAVNNTKGLKNGHIEIQIDNESKPLVDTEPVEDTEETMGLNLDTNGMSMGASGDFKTTNNNIKFKGNLKYSIPTFGLDLKMPLFFDISEKNNVYDGDIFIEMPDILQMFMGESEETMQHMTIKEMIDDFQEDTNTRLDINKVQIETEKELKKAYLTLEQNKNVKFKKDPSSRSEDGEYNITIDTEMLKKLSFAMLDNKTIADNLVAQQMNQNESMDMFGDKSKDKDKTDIEVLADLKKEIIESEDEINIEFVITVKDDIVSKIVAISTSQDVDNGFSHTATITVDIEKTDDSVKIIMPVIPEKKED